MTNEIRRMWVNQPSNLQQHHHLHGTRVLAIRDHDEIYQIYFLSGGIISQMIQRLALSEGWPRITPAAQQRPARDIAREIVSRHFGHEALYMAETYVRLAGLIEAAIEAERQGEL